MFPRKAGDRSQGNGGDCSPEKLGTGDPKEMVGTGPKGKAGDWSQRKSWGLDPKEKLGNVPQGTGDWVKKVDRHVPKGSGTGSGSKWVWVELIKINRII